MADKPGDTLDLDDYGSALPSPGAEMVSFRQRLNAGQFAVTAEIGPPRGADTAPVTRKAAELRQERP